MKASVLLLWTTLAVALGQSLSHGGVGSPFKKRYLFQTAAGPLYIAEWKNRFYPIFNDETLGSYSSPEAAAEDLSTNHLLSLPQLNVASLGIPADLKKWQRL